MKKSILLVSLVCFFALLSNGYARTSFSANHFAEEVICNMPSGPVTTDITQNSAIFNWYAVSGAMSYSVQIRQPGGMWNSLAGSPFTNTYAVATNLSAGTQYEWRVQTNCINGEYSNWTMSIFFTTLGGGGSCYEPDELVTTNITQTTATWDWNPVNGANSYSVQWRYPGGTWYNLPNGPYFNSQVSVAGLSPNTTYEWRVRSNCSNGSYSPWSLPDVFTTLGSSCSMPTYPITLSVGQTSASVDWDPVSGAQSYSVQYRLPGGTWYYAPGSPFMNSAATISGLAPGTTYEWRVRANCVGGSVSNWTSPIQFTTQGSGGGSCIAPDYLATLNVTSSSASFDWDPVSGAINYSVQWRVAGGTWYYLPGGPFYGTYLNVSGFNPGTTYEWRVRSNCANGMVSEWSIPASFTTLNVSCQQPYGLTTTNITETSALFSWAVIPGAQSYSVQIRTPGGAWNFLPGSPFMANSVTASNLNPGSNYEWRVRANCGASGSSIWSPPKAFTTLGSGGGTCEPPSWLGTTNITSTTATWDWSPGTGAISYSIEWRYPGGQWNNLNGGPFYNTWVNVGNLTPGTTYEWRVRSNCSNGSYSEWSYVVSFTTLGSSCNTPGGLFTSYITESAAMFNWNPVSGASSYSVQYRLPGGTWFYIPGSPFQNSPAQVFNLTPGTTYEWRVRANCYGGLHSAWSPALQFTTLGSASCNAPSWFNESNITQTSAVLEWNSVSGAVSYTVEYRISGGTWYQAPGSPFTNTWVNLMNLQPSTAYEWRVRSNCTNGGYSAWGPVQYFSTGGGSGSGIDNCDTALPLTVNGSCMNTAASNAGATPSMPPPAGNCYSNNYKDVWFTFTMPNVSNPQVTIRTTAGSLNDGVMEVYVGSTCSNMYFVACEDDNLNGNGSSMPVISLQGNAGAQVFVRFWGYGGMTGTFNICVLNYYTPNLVSYDLDDVVFEGEVIEPVENAINNNTINEIDKEQGILYVNPNPASDLMKIGFVQTPDCKVRSVAIADYSGKRIMTKTYEMKDEVEFSDEISVTDLPDGIYVLQMMTSCGLQTEKIVIAHR